MMKTSKKYIVALVSLTAFSALYAQDNPQKAQTSEILAFEKILGDLKEKKEQEVALPGVPKLNDMLPAPDVQTGKYEFNVMSTYMIGNDWYAYLLSDKNHIIKVKNGITLGNKKIVAINEYGVTLQVTNQNESLGKSYFMPITQQKIEEADVVFLNKKSEKNK